MGQEILGRIEASLRNGKPAPALAAAKEYVASAGATRDTGIEIAKAAAIVYRELLGPPVEEFAELADKELPEEVGSIVKKALERLFRINAEWEKRLWSVHIERLAREMRDWTRMRHLDPAAANISRLMALASDGQRPRRAAYIGNTLATVLNNQKEAKQLVSMLAKNPAKYFVIKEEIEAIEAARAERSQQMLGSNVDNLEREYTSVLTDAALEIKKLLPEDNRMDDPQEKELREVGDAFRSLFRVPILREEPDLFLDSSNIIAEYIPKEHSATAKIARVEGRIYGGLGFTAKKTVALSLMDIGRNKFLTSIYQRWARDFVGTDAIGNIVEVMGSLRTDEFNDFLRKIQGSKGLSQSVSTKLTSALGSIAGEAATDTLTGELRGILSKKRIGAAEMREAEQVLTNLGIIVKSPRTGDQERSQIREFVRSHVPEDLTKLARHAALELFTFKPKDITPQTLHWAIRVLTRSLFAPDETTVHHKGSAGSSLGDKHAATEALVKLVPYDIKTFATTVEPFASRYGAGFIAAAEVAEKVGDEALLVPLDRMLNTTLMHDDAAQNVYQQEFYWDPATEERKPLTKDKVLGPIIYSIGMIGGEKSKEILRRYQQQVSSNRVAPPTGDIATYMQRFLGDEAFGGGDVELDASGHVHLPPDEVHALLKQLGARYLLSGAAKRRAKKIEALTRLAQATPPEALDPVFAQLGDKDSFVVSAVITCLAQYTQPSTDKVIRDLAVNQAIDCLEHKDPAVRTNAIKLIHEIGPNRKDVKDKLLGFAKTVERPEVKLALAQAMKTGGGTSHSTENVATKAAAAGVKQSGEDEPMSAMSLLELKREYMQARREWISGGKKGDPPEKPPGVD